MEQRIHKNCVSKVNTGNSYLPMNFAIGNAEIAKAVFMKICREKILKCKPF